MEAEAAPIEIELSPEIEDNIHIEIRSTTDREHKKIELQLGLRRKKWPIYVGILVLILILLTVGLTGYLGNNSSTGPVNYKPICSSGPNCVIKYPNRSFPTYGNAWPDNLAICTFAAIGDWESIIKNSRPNPILMGIDFGRAGGDSKNGITMEDAFKYWKKQNINGQLLVRVDTLKPSKKNLKLAVRKYGAVLASMQLTDNGFLGNLRTSAGGHEIVVDGFTPSGPEIVTWGQTFVISWQQWKDFAQNIYGIKTVSSAK